MKVSINKLPESVVELVGELATERFQGFRPAALKQLNQEVKIDGFRTGLIPENILVSHLGEERILLTMAEFALQEVYPEILKENGVDAIGRPEISLTKLAKDNPLGFKIKTAVSPEFTLGDYRQIAKKINQKPTENPEVTEQEVEEVITEINKDKTREITPELREKIKENLKLEKNRKNRDKKRLEIVEEIIKQTEIVLPKVLVEAELEKMLDEMKHQIEQMGLKFADYLKHIKKTENDLKVDWQSEAEKRLKTGLILTRIAKTEKLEAPAEEVEKETKHLLEHYKDVPEDRARHYMRDILLVETVWRFLENQA